MLITTLACATIDLMLSISSAEALITPMLSNRSLDTPVSLSITPRILASLRPAKATLGC